MAFGLSSGIWNFLSMFAYKLDKSDIQREILAKHWYVASFSIAQMH